MDDGYETIKLGVSIKKGVDNIRKALSLLERTEQAFNGEQKPLAFGGPILRIFDEASSELAALDVSLEVDAQRFAVGGELFDPATRDASIDRMREYLAALQAMQRDADKLYQGLDAMRRACAAVSEALDRVAEALSSPAALATPGFGDELGLIAADCKLKAQPKLGEIASAVEDKISELEANRRALDEKVRTLEGNLEDARPSVRAPDEMDRAPEGAPETPPAEAAPAEPADEPAAGTPPSDRERDAGPAEEPSAPPEAAAPDAGPPDPADAGNNNLAGESGESTARDGGDVPGGTPDESAPPPPPQDPQDAGEGAPGTTE